MAFKDSIFSRLFRPNESKKEAEPAVEEESVPTPEPTPQVEQKPELQELIELRLPFDHAIYQLRNIRTEEGASVPSPSLKLTEQPDALTTEEAQRELSRLQVSVTATAKKRLGEIKAQQDHKKSKGENAEQPEKPSLDARAILFMTTGQLTAWLLAYPPLGDGKELDKDILSQALADSKITFGIDEELLERLPTQDDKYFHLFPIAKGRRAVHGKDGYVIDLFSRTVEHSVTVDEHNRVDYTALNQVQNVEEGEDICRIVPPTLGVPGMTVQGKELSARDGRKATPPMGRNTELNEDGTRLRACKTGHVEFSGRNFFVKPVLEIGSNVDYSTGNINFVGDVHIHGDVCSGFSVRALGNISVDGVVEACVVEAGGDLIIAGGVQGDNQATIRAHRNIYAKFLENSSVYAKENLQTECIVNCDVYSDGTVDVCKGWGTIIGGKVRAAQEVSANVVGSRAENITNIDLGGLPCEDFERELLNKELTSLESELEKTGRQPESPHKFSSLAKMRMQININKSKLAQMDEDLEKLDEMVQVQKGQRLKCGLAYPGTIITIGNASLRLEHEVRPCTATMVEGEIRLS